MQRRAEDLQWPSDIHGVHALVESDKNLDGLGGTIRFLVDCTHRVCLVVWKVLYCEVVC